MPRYGGVGFLTQSNAPGGLARAGPGAVMMGRNHRERAAMIDAHPDDRATFHAITEGTDPATFTVVTRAPVPGGSLPLTEAMLRDWPSGDLFGLSQNAGMGWSPDLAAGDPYLILSTQGGLRGPAGEPIALGYHTGHWEVGLLV